MTLTPGGLDETIRLWDLPSGRSVRTITGHNGWINALAFSPDGSRLASAGRDGSVRTWDVAAGQALLTIGDYPSEVFTVAFSPDGRFVASDR